MESKLQLIDMPEDPMRHILERCDFVSLQCLRKTCITFRNFIDETKPLQLNALDVFGSPKSFSLSLSQNIDDNLYPNGGKIVLDYNDLGDGSTEILWYQMDGIREKIIENSNNLNVFSRDFGTVLGCTQPKWGEISLRCHANVLKKIQEHLLSLTSPLKVHTLLILSADCQDSVMDILRSLCPDTLTHLDLAAAGEHWNMSEIVKLEQWKKTKQLDMTEVRASADIESYFHFENAKFCFENVTMDDLCKMKELFLNTPSITKSFKLFGVHVPSQEMVITTWGQPFFSWDLVTKYWYFKRPDNYVLLVNSSVADFFFDIITKDDVPQNALIL